MPARTPRTAATLTFRQRAARGSFLHLYDTDPAFATDLRCLYRARVRPLPWLLPDVLADWWWPLLRPGPAATHYVETLEDLAARHGLNRFRDDPEPGIGREQIHRWCLERSRLGPSHWPPSRFSDGFGFAIDEPAIFPIEHESGTLTISGRSFALTFAEEVLAPTWDPRREPRASAEKRLRATGSGRSPARADLSAIDETAARRGYRRARKRGEGTASDLDRDFRWLYRRVHGETSAEIAASEGDPSLGQVVHKATTRMARLVNIRVRGWDGSESA